MRVRAGVFLDSLYASECFVKNVTPCHRPGLDIEIFEGAMRILNWNYEYVFPAEAEYGQMKDGSWSGLVGSLLRNETDMTAMAFRITPERRSVVDFSFPTSYYKSIYLFAKPKEHESISVVEKPFESDTWFFVIFMVVLVGFLQWLHAQIQQGKGPSLAIFRLSFFNSLALILKQGLPSFWLNYRTFPLTIWAFLSLYLILVYQSVLSSILIVPLPSKIPFLNLKGLLDNILTGEYHLTNSIDAKPICPLSQCDYLDEILEDHPVRIFTDALKMVHDIEQEHGVYPGVEDGDLYESTVNTFGSTPLVVLVDDTAPRSWLAFAFSRNMSRRKQHMFNEALVHMLPGFPSIKFRYKTRQMKLYQIPSAFQVRLGFGHLWDIVVIFVSGVGVSMLVFTAEIYSRQLCKNTRSKYEIAVRNLND